MMKNEKIVSAFDAVVLSEEDSQRIYGKILSPEEQKPRHTVSRRFAAVLAAVLVMILAAGTVLAEVIEPMLTKIREESTAVTPDGEIITEVFEYDVYDEEPEINYDHDWLVENCSLTKLAIDSEAPYCAGFYGLYERADGDYEKLESLIPDNCVLRLPEYIPEGFELKTSQVALYLTEEDAMGAEKAVETFVSDGTIYQCYQLPDSVTDNIRYADASFVNRDGDEITFFGNLSEDIVSKIGAEPDVKVSFAEIEGFEKVICLTDSKQNYCMAYRGIDPIASIAFDNIGNEERAKMHGVEVLDFGGCQFRVESYSAYSSTVSMEELLRILESLA